MRDTRQIAEGIAEQGKFVDSNTAAIKLGFSRSRVHQLISEGRLEAVRMTERGWWRISKESLERMLAQRWNRKP
jgi:excisionase family DNA binding protein